MPRPGVIAGGVPRETTQPAADQLLSYADYLERLRLLAANPRVRVSSIGTSYEGRDIPLISIADPQVLYASSHLQDVARLLAGPTIVHRSVRDPVEVRPGLSTIPSDARVPVLFAGGSFGFEASHLESLLELAEALAGATGPSIERILASIVVLIVPCMNPDGREQALAEWRVRPLSSGSSGLGNHYGVLENRDFLHLSQPESRALANLVSTWSPFLVWDAHEDGFLLGREFPEVCLAPPTGVDEPDHVGGELTEQVRRVGAAIAAAWEREGFAYLYHPRGEHAWMKARDDQPVAKSGFGGRLAYAMGLRGIPAFITESARALGTQTWQDRNRQKVTAGIAILEEIATDPSSLVCAVRTVRTRAFETAREAAHFYLVPGGQEPFLVAEAIRVLQAHGIDVYRAGQAQESLIVPVAQLARYAVDALLGIEAGAQDALIATLGIRVIPSSALNVSERKSWSSATLAALGPFPVFSRLHPVTPDKPRLRVPNSLDGVKLINRLLRVPGAQVRWNRGTGDFFVGGAISADSVNDAASGLRVARPATAEVSEQDWDSGASVRAPRVGLYVGQGANYAQGASSGSLRWFLKTGEFSVAEFNAHDLTEEALSRIDMLIVPNGSAAQMMDGWDPRQLWYDEPWDMPGERYGMGEPGASAIRRYVENGGMYLGIDAGGGWLAGPRFLGLLDFEVAAHNLGIGIVDLELVEPGATLFSGVSGSWSDIGDWRPGIIRSLYWSEPFSDVDGGSVFRPGAGTRVLARYARANGAVVAGTLVEPERLTAAGSDGAIVTGTYGRGAVTVFGIEPTFRCYWFSTFHLVSNAIFSAASTGVQ